MARYDRYLVTISREGTSADDDRRLEVLIEEGDNVEAVIAEANRVLGLGEASAVPPLFDQMLAVEPFELADICKEVWLQHFPPLGQQKYVLANEYRNNINAAQNA